jgi:hypothetical protein
MPKLRDMSDDLNLAGLLNVLDGVVDCPGRIVVMTSNHPDLLDPALVRPGRISKRIFMGYMGVEEATKMVRHHFPEASGADVELFQAKFGYHEIGPAHLEALCAEHDNLCNLTQKLHTCFADLAVESGEDLPASAAVGTPDLLLTAGQWDDMDVAKAMWPRPMEDANSSESVCTHHTVRPGVVCLDSEESSHQRTPAAADRAVKASVQEGCHVVDDSGAEGCDQASSAAVCMGLLVSRNRGKAKRRKGRGTGTGQEVASTFEA